MSSMIRRLLVILLCFSLIGAGWWLWRKLSFSSESEDPVNAFLARHWKKPLAAQGMPPPSLSPKEASLAPQACAECHVNQHRDWSTSLHSQTMGNGILWQARALSPAEVVRCLDCHAPLAEQKTLLGCSRGCGPCATMNCR